MKLTVGGGTFTVGDDTFTVSDDNFLVSNETYIGVHITVPVSFITDCKSVVI